MASVPSSLKQGIWMMSFFTERAMVATERRLRKQHFFRSPGKGATTTRQAPLCGGRKPPLFVLDHTKETLLQPAVQVHLKQRECADVAGHGDSRFHFFLGEVV